MMGARCTNGVPSMAVLAGAAKVQHHIQSALNKRWDSGRSLGSPSHSPIAMLEQMQERLHNIARDMYILNKSCGEEIVRSSVRKAAPKRRRRARRNR